MIDKVVIGGDISLRNQLAGDAELQNQLEGDVSLDNPVEGDTELNSFIDGEIQLNNLLEGEAGTYIRVSSGDSPAYHGDYTVTPSRVQQTLPTAGMVLDRNVTVEPIPSNYGLITWDGSTLTVS